MENKELINANFNSLRIIFLVLLGAQMMFLIICCVIVFTNNYHVSEVSESVFTYLVPAFIFINFTLGTLFYSYRLKLKKKEADFEEIARKYVSQSIIRWAFFEGAAFLTILAFLITGVLLYLYVAVFVIAVYILTMPRLEKMEDELGRLA